MEEIEDVGLAELELGQHVGVPIFLRMGHCVSSKNGAL
jgi:hypothetical protein